FLLGALGGDQVGVPLIVPPGERVGVPVQAVKVQQLRFQPPAGQGDGPHKHPIFGKVQAEVMPVHHAGDRLGGRVQGGGRLAREGDPVFRRRTVLPLSAVHHEREYAGLRRGVLSRDEQTGLGQFRRKVGVGGGSVISLDGVHGAAVVV